MVLVDGRRPDAPHPPITPRSAALRSGPRRLASGPAVAPTVVGLFASLYVGLGSWIPSVWYDEAATITSATRSWGQLAAELRKVDIVHGLYYAGMHLWFDLVGYSPLTLRAPSAVAIGITAAVLVLALRAAAGARIAVLSGLVLPLIPRVAWAGGEGRSYAFSIMAAVLTSAALWLALRTGRRRWWLAYGILGTLSALLFLYLVLLLVAHAVTVAALAVGRRIGLREVAAFAITVVAAVAAVSPLALLARRQDAQLDWIPPIGPHTAHFVLAGQWFSGSWPVAAGFGVLVVGGVVVLLRRRSMLTAWLLPVIIVPTAALLTATAVVGPLYSPRYLAFAGPAIAVAAGAAIAAIPIRPARAVALLLVVAMSLPLVVTHLRQPDSKQQSTWSEVADLIAEQRAADPVPTAILWGPVRYHPSATARVIEYAYPGPFEGTIDPTLLVPAAESGRLWEKRGMLHDSLADLDGARTAYMITSVKRDWIPSYTATLAGIGWTPVERWSLGDVNVVKFSPSAR